MQPAWSSCSGPGLHPGKEDTITMKQGLYPQSGYVPGRTVSSEPWQKIGEYYSSVLSQLLHVELGGSYYSSHGSVVNTGVKTLLQAFNYREQHLVFSESK